MNIKLMRYFAAVCEAGSLSKAADQLFLSRQALSEAIKSLEIEMNVKLLKRDRTGISMTEAGEYFHSQSEKILTLYDETMKRLGEIKKSSTTVVPVYFCMFTIDAKRLAALQRFSDRHSGIEIYLQQRVSEQCWDALEDGRAELACTLKPSRPGFSTELLHKTTVYLLVGKQSALAKRKQIDNADDLRNLHLLFLQDTKILLEQIIQCCGKRGFTPNWEYILPDQTLITELVSSGKSEFIVPAQTLHMYPADRITAIPMYFPEVDHSLYLVWNAHKPLSDAAKELSKYLLSCKMW